MRADLMHVVTCYSNPLRWETRLRHAKNFIEHMKDSGVHLTVVETQHGERPFELDQIPGITHIPTRASTMAWSKESAVNLGIRALPADAKYVSWIDADVHFHNKDWAAEAVHELQLVPVLQPWSEALDLGPKGQVMKVKNRQVQTSFGYVWREYGNVLDWWKNLEAYAYPHSGYAWSATMTWLEQVGLLLDFSGAGSADHQIAHSLVGNVNYAIHGLSTDSYKDHVRAWGERAYRVTQGHVGYVPGLISHMFHGRKELRKYIERWDILNRHKFDPLTDVHRNRWGILELSNNKPEFRREMEAYFLNRAEDDNCL